MQFSFTRQLLTPCGGLKQALISYGLILLRQGPAIPARTSPFRLRRAKAGMSP